MKRSAFRWMIAFLIVQMVVVATAISWMMELNDKLANKEYFVFSYVVMASLFVCGVMGVVFAVLLVHDNKKPRVEKSWYEVHPTGLKKVEDDFYGERDS